ncbi:PREDICTED: mitogen-activated protein kinase 15 isoform X2 [Cercocebus atys]|uniref:mitogen-activated protein kinase 15 isoform X2 n=1 Tax=Cercocebus atys TaxID=9531 RepID=UPI0005F580E1|nr:PREDICTED: mitogen-activated protein kinase 15 isoform X2 [Cercocebus atys]
MGWAQNEGQSLLYPCACVSMWACVCVRGRVGGVPGCHREGRESLPGSAESKCVAPVQGCVCHWIGDGERQAYGIVWKAVDRRTGEVVAIKKIFDAFRDKTDAQRTFREIMLLQEFGDHPNIISLLDVIQAENDRDIYLVFEFMDTDLNAVIRKGGLLQDVHVRSIFYQLLQATRFLHSGHVVHRDQKPSNVLLDANCTVKLCDFGLARSLGDLPEGPEDQALTEYVATRWYRAPEVLLSSHRYTLGVDMWSLGCILGEMLRGRPLFPGTSTLHQLELILETIPPPSKEDLLALGSGCRASVLHCLGSRPRQTLDALLPPDTSPEALDLLRRLLVFTPDKRLSATQALQHPYVQRFHCPSDEWARKEHVQLRAREGVQLSAPEYRSRVYQMILECKGSNGTSREKGLEGVSPSQAHLHKPRADPKLPSGTPVQGPRPRPQSSPSHDPPEHEFPRAAKSTPRQNSAPTLQPALPGSGERPPGAKEEPPLTFLLEKPGRRGAAPSLTSQAAAQVANQALIRGDWNRGGGVRVASTQQVPPRCPPEARPGRRMFSTSALQGAQGAARALLGGYSQAYGTVCHSALGHLPLLERHRV